MEFIFLDRLLTITSQHVRAVDTALQTPLALQAATTVTGIVMGRASTRLAKRSSNSLESVVYYGAVVLFFTALATGGGRVPLTEGSLTSLGAHIALNLSDGVIWVWATSESREGKTPLLLACSYYFLRFVESLMRPHGIRGEYIPFFHLVSHLWGLPIERLQPVASAMRTGLNRTFQIRFAGGMGSLALSFGLVLYIKQLNEPDDGSFWELPSCKLVVCVAEIMPLLLGIATGYGKLPLNARVLGYTIAALSLTIADAVAIQVAKEKSGWARRVAWAYGFLRVGEFVYRWNLPEASYRIPFEKLLLGRGE